MDCQCDFTMLVFIEEIKPRADLSYTFQYIPCWYLSLDSFFIFQARFSFNTSHVGIYLCLNERNLVRSVVSIHPMLVFIFTMIAFTTILISFNTSHVGIYRSNSCLSHVLRVSIHPMLVFIPYCVKKKGVYKSFNTSHVGIYQYFAN